MDTPDGSVIWLSDGLVEFPHFVFVGDTDMTLPAMVSLTARANAQIVLVKLRPDELKNESFMCSAALSRASERLGRSDLHYVQLLRTGQVSSVPGESFSSFSASSSKVRPTYSSISGSGEASEVRSETPDEFCASGGSILVVDV